MTKRPRDIGEESTSAPLMRFRLTLPTDPDLGVLSEFLGQHFPPSQGPKSPVLQADSRRKQSTPVIHEDSLRSRELSMDREYLKLLKPTLSLTAP